jgi:hypothetical protein
MLPAGPDPIKELDWMGRNVMSMMLEGTFSYNSTPVETLDEKRAAIWEYSEQYHPGEKYLEYAIIPHQNYYNVGEKVQFDLLEWGNYHDCWNLKLRIIDRHDEYVYEDNSVRYCLEPDGTPGTYHSYSMGKQFDEFVCEQPGYYRIELSNVDVFPPTILQNFACLESESDVVDSLKIPNAERDTKLAAGYKLYPGVGWVHPDDLGNQQPIYRDNPNKPEELILDLDAMIKAKESERLSQVLRLCENTDAQYLGALSFENSTHHIDSQTCTWKLLNEN